MSICEKAESYKWWKDVTTQTLIILKYSPNKIRRKDKAKIGKERGNSYQNSGVIFRWEIKENYGNKETQLLRIQKKIHSRVTFHKPSFCCHEVQHKDIEV